MIEATELTKTFGDFTAVKNISLDVPAGQILALLGHNGAGKTTTTRMLTAILAPTNGRAVIGGYDTVSQSLEVRRIVGHLTELPGLYNRMRVEEYLDFFGDLQNVPKPVRKEYGERMLKQFDLWETRRLRMGEYSKGMRQKAALIRALIHEPKVLFLDEPTSAMDPYSAKMVRDAISELKAENRTIVLCTHNLFEAEALADKIVIIRKGEIVIEGTSTELKDRLLGAPAYEVTTVQPIENDKLLTEVRSLVQVSEVKGNTLTFTTQQASQLNPLVLRKFVEYGYDIVTLQELSRSLESVYLKIAGTPQAPASDEADHSKAKLGKRSNKRNGHSDEPLTTTSDQNEQEAVNATVNR